MSLIREMAATPGMGLFLFLSAIMAICGLLLSALGDQLLMAFGYSPFLMDLPGMYLAFCFSSVEAFVFGFFALGLAFMGGALLILKTLIRLFEGQTR